MGDGALTSVTLTSSTADLSTLLLMLPPLVTFNRFFFKVSMAGRGIVFVEVSAIILILSLLRGASSVSLVVSFVSVCVQMNDYLVFNPLYFISLYHNNM